MKSLRSILILVAVLIVAGNLPSLAQTPEQLFQRGLVKEEGEGAMEEAINLYSQIADNSNADQTLRAKALLHIGMCYERMGTLEAIETYQRLVSDFPTQKKEVALARERLNRLMPIVEKVAESPPVPKFTKIQNPSELSWSVRLSPDGKDLALVFDKKLWKMPLSSNIGPEFPGKPIQVETDGIPLEWTSLSWSYDGNWIAFNEIPLEDRPENEKLNQSIFIVPADGGQPRKIVENYRDFSEKNYRISISPDGKKVAYTSVENDEQHIYTKQTAGGPQKQLVETQAREPVFSPNGKWIAYVEDNALGYAGGNLYIVPATGGVSRLVAKSNKASSPVWSPDGSIIAYIDEESSNQIKFVQVQDDGNTTGKVSNINIPEGLEKVMVLAGWASNNKIGALITTEQEYSLYTLPAKGGQATKILHDRLAIQPRWSPAGDRVIYITTKNGTLEEAPNFALASVPANGGSGRIYANNQNKEFVRPSPPQAGYRFSPDGKSIVFAGWMPGDTIIGLLPATRIWKLFTDSHELEKLTNESGSFEDLSPSWSPDGKKIAFVRYSIQDIVGTNMKMDRKSIYIINSTGGEPELLFSEDEKSILLPVWSPDGKMIAYISRMQDSECNLNVINVDNGSVRSVCEIPQFIPTMDPCWSPDSRQIAYNDGSVIKIVNLSDGTTEDIETNLKDEVNIIYNLDWSPDGEQFVFGGANQGEDEFWILEDFLPLESPLQKSETEVAEVPGGIKIKQIWKIPYLGDIGTVSSDGRFRSFVDSAGWGDLAIHNLMNGEIRVLTHEADTGRFVLNTAISKNGLQIAYCWWGPNHTYDLCLVDVDNPLPRLLYRQEGEEVSPMTWLSENELIITRFIRETNTADIVSFNISNNTLQVLKPFERTSWPQLACSPDEKYIAYDFENESNSENFDINLLPVDGSDEISLVNHPANDRVLGWVPGRREFLFISDRSGNWDLWAIPVESGKPAGTAKRIYTDIGAVQPVGFAQNGDCFFGFSRRSFNAYLKPFNVEKGEVTENKGEALLGSNFWVKWSPDGQSLAYISENSKSENPWQLTIKDLTTGKERKLAENLFTAEMPCWSPDGNSILVLGREKIKVQTNDFNRGIYLVDVKTGQTTEILQLSDYKYNVPDDYASPLSDLEWSADGKSFYYLFFKDRLVKHDLESGEDKVIYEHSNFAQNLLSRSPDGKNLLFAVSNPGEKKSHLYTVPAEGGKETELCTSQEAGFVGGRWSPDGQYIFFTEATKGTSLWRVSVEGGIPQKVWQSENRTELFSIHPNGKQIAFSIRERTTEIRAIENLAVELSKVFK